MIKANILVVVLLFLSQPLFSEENRKRQCLIAHAEDFSVLPVENQIITTFEMTFEEGFVYLEKLKGHNMRLYCGMVDIMACNFYSYDYSSTVSEALFDAFSRYVVLKTYSPDYGAFTLSCQ